MRGRRAGPPCSPLLAWSYPYPARGGLSACCVKVKAAFNGWGGLARRRETPPPRLRSAGTQAAGRRMRNSYIFYIFPPPGKKALCPGAGGGRRSDARGLAAAFWSEVSPLLSPEEWRGYHLSPSAADTGLLNEFPWIFSNRCSFICCVPLGPSAEALGVWVFAIVLPRSPGKEATEVLMLP